MKKIYVKPWRDLVQMKGRAVLVGLIVAGGVAIYGGGFMARDTFFHTRDTYFTQLHLADLEVSTTAAEEKEIPSFDGLKGVTAMTRSLLMPGSIELPDGKPYTIVVAYVDPSRNMEVNSLKMLEGRFLSPDDAEGVVIERSMAQYHGFKVGDTITLNPYSFPQDVVIRGIAITPKFLLPSANPDVMIPAKGSLGVVFANKALVENFFGYQMYNNFSFLFDAGIDKKALEDRINRIAAPLDIHFFLRKQDQFSYRFLEQDLKGFGIFIPATVAVFGLLASIVISLAVNRLIKSQLKEIGGLLALGYTPAALMKSYLILGLIIGVLGGLIGTAGAFGICHLFAGKYASVVGLPPLLYVYPAKHLIKGFLFGVAVSLLSTCIPLVRLAGILPREALSGAPNLGFTFRRSFLSETAWVSTTTLFGLRNLFRRPGLTVSTIVLIALAISLSTAFIITESTVEHFADTAFHMEDWDAIAAFRTPLGGKDLQEIVSDPMVEKWHPMVHGVANLRTRAGESAHYGIVGAPARGFMRRFKFLSGSWFTRDDSYDIVLNNNFYRLPGVTVGDTITVTAKNTDYAFTVRGLVSDLTMGVAFAPIETVRRIFNLEEKSSGIFAVSSHSSEDLKKALFSHEIITYITLKTEMRDQVREALAQVRAVTRVAIGVSIFMAILFLISSLTINILERESEYATLGALGYSRPSIVRIVITEVMSEAAIALVLSVPVSILTAHYLNYAMAKAWFQFEIYLNPRDFLSVMIPAVLATPVATIPGLKTIFSLNLPQVLGVRA